MTADNQAGEFVLRQKQVFLDALEIEDGQERAAFIVRACGGDRSLREQVESLITVDGSTPDTYLDPTVMPSATPPAEQPGTTLGRYTLIERLGEGAFGIVFRASQEEPVKREVALKIIRPGMDSEDVVRRFEAERQALAIMDHPSIAHVYDAGTTELGRPYFVMEIVRGVPITDYCDQHRRTIRQRLELFIEVCQAVQHAHQKGIIHRDLKPSNILVVEHEGRPLPKIIDFGIARAIERELTGRTVLTAEGRFIGTPQYMSPEQAFGGSDIDTRADVYALGVVLYELLTGTTQFTTKELSEAGWTEMARIIREVDPPRPSQRVGALDAVAGPAVAASRGSSDSSRCGRQLRGDLDWIVMRALAKERSRRYETANAIAEDVQRHLSSEPVMARAPSTGYRLARAVRRHKMAFAVGAAVFLSLAVGLALSTHLVVKLRVANKDVAKMRVTEALAAGDCARVATEIEAARAAHVDDETLLLMEGQRLMLQGQVAAAAGVLQQVVDRQPRSVAPRALLALACIMDGKWTPYEQHMAVLQKLERKTWDDRLCYGQALAQSDTVKGIEMIRSARDEHPTSMAHAMLGDAQTTLAIETGSLADAEEAVRSIEAAQRLTRDGVPVMAISCWTHAVAAGIANRDGEAELAKRWRDLAEREGERLESHFPNPFAVMHRTRQLDICHHLDGGGGTNPADTLIENQWRENPHPSFVRLLLESLMRNGRVDEALAVIAEYPGTSDFAEACRMLAVVEVSRGSPPVELFQQLGTPPDSGRGAVHTMFAAPAALNTLGRPADATKAAQEFLDHLPAAFASLPPHYRRTAAFLAGRLSEEEILEASSDSQWYLSEVHAQIAVRRLGEGDRAGARRHLELCVGTQAWRGVWFSSARIVLARLDADPSWPPWIPPKATR